MVTSLNINVVIMLIYEWYELYVWLWIITSCYSKQWIKGVAGAINENNLNILIIPMG
jgi:hypothetical protein